MCEHIHKIQIVYERRNTRVNLRIRAQSFRKICLAQIAFIILSFSINLVFFLFHPSSSSSYFLFAFFFLFPLGFHLYFSSHPFVSLISYSLFFLPKKLYLWVVIKEVIKVVILGSNINRIFIGFLFDGGIFLINWL